LANELPKLKEMKGTNGLVFKSFEIQVQKT